MVSGFELSASYAVPDASILPMSAHLDMARSMAEVQRTSENERFYEVENIRNKQILAGEVQPPPGTMVSLWETLQAAEGQSHDANKLPPPNEKSPGDCEIEKPREESHREYDEFADHNERMDAKT